MMRTICEPDEHHGGVYELDEGEGAILFDEACQNKLGIGGDRHPRGGTGCGLCVCESWAPRIRGWLRRIWCVTIGT